MPKPPRPSASEVLRHNLLILVGLPSHNVHIMKHLGCIHTSMYILCIHDIKMNQKELLMSK